MKHRTINSVRTRREKRAKKNKKLLITLAHKVSKTFTWNSGAKGYGSTYVKQVHGQLK